MSRWKRERRKRGKKIIRIFYSNIFSARFSGCELKYFPDSYPILTHSIFPIKAIVVGRVEMRKRSFNVDSPLKLNANKKL